MSLRLHIRIFSVMFICGYAVAAPQPLAWYPFDGDTVDPVGFYRGTLAGQPVFGEGIQGRRTSCLVLDGQNDKVTLPRMIQDDFTIAFWLKTTDQGGGGQWYRGAGLVDGEVGGVTHDFGTVLLGDTFAFGVGKPDTTLSAQSRINDGSWHHVVATRQQQDGLMTVYVDGVREGQKSGPAGRKDAPDKLVIGALQTNIHFFAGRIDDLRIYDQVVSEAHIRDLALQRAADPEINTDVPPPNAQGDWGLAMVQARRAYGNAGDTHAIWKEIAAAHPVPFDWLLQDLGNDLGEWLRTNRNTQLEKQLIQQVIDELSSPPSDLTKRFNDLKSRGAGADDTAWLDFYAEVCELRRAQRLELLLETSPRIVFTKHFNMGGSHYAYTEAVSDDPGERNFVGGSSLCWLEMDGLYARVFTWLSDADGVIRDPDVHFDGERVLFAWKKSNRNDDYHLYELGVASGTIRQITAGLGFADYEGVYTPDGNIIFNSTRCVQSVDCFSPRVSNLYTCTTEGRFLRRLSFDQVHSNYPQFLDDGRVIYTRWDYSDRSQMYPQPLFQMNPDGTKQTEFYGNNSWFPTSILHARGIPGTNRVLAIASGHHTRQIGKLIVVDTTLGRQENQGVQLIAPIRNTKAVHIDGYGRKDGPLWQYPYPLNDTEYLVTYCPLSENENGPWPQQEQGRCDNLFGIYWMDIHGRRELLVFDSERSCNQPVPLRSRPYPHTRPSLVNYSKTSGTYYVHDVYQGPGLQGVSRGSAKSLRIVALEYRPAAIGTQFHSGPDSGHNFTPPSIRGGTWDVKRVLGTVPIYEDGSAMFTVPARTPVYFQVLNEKNHMIQTMRSWSTLQPGEFFSCTGCHEDKNEGPTSITTPSVAMNVGPVQPEPFYGPARGFSFPTEIQPILDRHCIRCHDIRPGQSKKSGHAFSLLGTETKLPKTDKDNAKRQFSDAYLALTDNGDPYRDIVNWVSCQSVPTMLLPYYPGVENKAKQVAQAWGQVRSKLNKPEYWYCRGAATSDLVTLLERGHKQVRLNAEELDKLACWIDLLVPYCGRYDESHTWSNSEKERYQYFVEKRQRMEAVEAANIQEMIDARN